jgi:hypothetical protein
MAAYPAANILILVVNALFQQTPQDNSPLLEPLPPRM